MAKNPIEPLLENILTAAKSDEQFEVQLYQDPSAIMSGIGFRIPDEHRAEFNNLFLNETKPLLAAMVPGSSFPSLPNAKCAACKIGAYLIAAAIVGLGAAGLTLLTPASPVIVALAGFAGAGPTATLGFVSGLGSFIATGAAGVALQICKWMGVCP